MIYEDDNTSPVFALGVAPGEAVGCDTQCSVIWRALLRGELEVVHLFTEGHTAGIVLCFKRSSRILFSERNLAMLERLLSGTSAKVLALDFGLSASTVAQVLKSMLQAMGFACSPARVSPLLVLLAHEARAATPSTRFEVERSSRDGAEYLVLRADLDRSAFAGLAPAEKAVMWQRVFGRSLADIAAARNTSARTVANQIAHAYGRLGISGRLDLLQLLAL